MVVGIGLLSTIHPHIHLFTVGAYMAILGIGMGSVNQNLVLAVQNNAAQKDIGAASSLAAFFRTMGGSIGVSALGAALGHAVSASLVTGLAAKGITPPAGGHSNAQIPDMTTLPGPLRSIYEVAFADGTGHIFLLATPFAALAMLAILLIKEVPLRQTIEREDELRGTPASAAEHEEARPRV
jgi:hypothetical protein